MIERDGQIGRGAFPEIFTHHIAVNVRQLPLHFDIRDASATHTLPSPLIASWAVTFDILDRRTFNSPQKYMQGHLYRSTFLNFKKCKNDYLWKVKFTENMPIHVIASVFEATKAVSN